MTTARDLAGPYDYVNAVAKKKKLMRLAYVPNRTNHSFATVDFVPLTGQCRSYVLLCTHTAPEDRSSTTLDGNLCLHFKPGKTVPYHAVRLQCM